MCWVKSKLQSMIIRKSLLIDMSMYVDDMLVFISFRNDSNCDFFKTISPETAISNYLRCISESVCTILILFSMSLLSSPTYVSGGALFTFGLTLLTCRVVVVFISWFAIGDSRAVGAALLWLRFITVGELYSLSMPKQMTFVGVF